jgi:murein DD-endopeptidase MepM/ murein hydrolase activator NlpD
MKKSLFYYSEKNMKYVEIKNFYAKFLSFIVLFSTIFALIFLSSYIFITDVLHPESDIVRLNEENENLKEKFIEMSSQISQFNSELDLLNSKDDELRISVNLDPLSEEELNFGIGGAAFDEIKPTSISDISNIINDVDYSIDLLKSKLVIAKNNYSKIEKSLADNIELFKSIPAIRPSDGPIGDRFGMRKHPILNIRRMHTGIDIIINTGNNVYAPGDGKIIKIGTRGGYGRTVEIDHGFGYTSLYAHLSKIKVKKGQMVNRGDLIGLSGQSGSLATGPHLHYEIKHNGVHLNPKNFIFSDIKVFDLLTEKGSHQEYKE